MLNIPIKFWNKIINCGHVRNRLGRWYWAFSYYDTFRPEKDLPRQLLCRHWTLLASETLSTTNVSRITLMINNSSSCLLVCFFFWYSPGINPYSGVIATHLFEVCVNVKYQRKFCSNVFFTTRGNCMMHLISLLLTKILPLTGTYLNWDCKWTEYAMVF